MRTAGVIGWPIGHSKSPLIHRFWLAALGLDADYARFPVHPDRLAGALAGLPALGLSGVSVTVPHKVAALAHVHHLSETAGRIGALNLVVVRPDGTLHGDNSDVAGVLASLGDWQGGTAIVVGAGGAARAVLEALRQRRAARVTLLNRTRARAEALLAEFALPGTVLPLDAPLPAADLLVNASSLGMAGEPPFAPDLEGLPPHALVHDIVYAPLETPLLKAARARGLATIDGLEMLVAQAAVAFEAFYGVQPPRHRDRDLRARLLEGSPA
ncbi:shikimate dehydrogenase [Thermaurantiacus sp.]